MSVTNKTQLTRKSIYNSQQSFRESAGLENDEQRNTAVSWVTKVGGGQEVPIFRKQTDCKFRQKRLWVL